MIEIQTPKIPTGRFNFSKSNSTSTLDFPTLHQAQRSIVADLGRFNVINCGRRFGKTTLGVSLCEPASRGQYIGWFFPSYKYLVEVWRELVRVFSPVKRRISAQEKRIELASGGVIEMWSLADNPDAGRSRRYHRAIVDEAAMVAKLEQAWQEGIRATLTDWLGDAFFLSTPKGFNYFKALYDRGQDPLFANWRSWQMPTSENPYIQQSEIDDARSELPERIFNQEYLARFIDDAGIFRGVIECATAKEADPLPGRRYVVGVDWGKHEDFTVITVMDTVLGEMVYLDRFNQIDYSYQSDRLKSVIDKYKPQTVLAEANSMGEAIIDQLRRDGVSVRGFTMTSASKSRIINELALAFERGSIKILPDHTLVSELQAFEATRLPGGGLRYAAPSGQHDDTVVSLALALEASSNVDWSALPEASKISPWDISPSGGNRWQL